MALEKQGGSFISVVMTNLSTVLLIVAAFMIGMLWSKVQLLEQGGGTPTPTAQQPAGDVPAPVTQLSDDQWKAVQQNPVAQIGNKNAKVTIVEFTDFQCPFCEQYATTTFPEIKKNFIDTNKVNYLVRDLPLSFHANAHVAAELARCAADQGKYWQMHDALFANQDKWSTGDPKATFEQLGKDAGLNTANLMKCFSDGKYKKAVDDDLALAGKSGADGTPTFFINGKAIVGALPYAEFEKEIKSALGE